MNDDKTKISEEEKKQQIEKMWSDYEKKDQFVDDTFYFTNPDEDYYD